MLQTLNPAQILLDAAALGKKHGIAIGMFHNPDTGGMCINGLICCAILGRPAASRIEYQHVMDDPQVRPITQAIITTIGNDNLPTYFGAVEDWRITADWNNKPSTPGQVISVLESTADRLRLAEGLAQK